MEQWISISHSKYANRKTIVAVSNLGRIKRLDGTIEESKYRTRLSGGRRIYHIIADNFLITVHSKEQKYIDHITHNPIGMNLNDVRNLRWCTIKENNNFEECRMNKSKSKKGQPSWNKGLTGKDYTKHYKNGIKNQYTGGIVCGQ